MIYLLLRLLPVTHIILTVGAVIVLQAMGIDVIGMASDFFLDLLGLPDWSGDWFGGLL